MMRILVLNGPNLNLLGKRQPEVYGLETLADIETLVRTRAAALGIEIDFEQANAEGALVDYIQAHAGWDGLIINAAAYTHTSLAIADAVTSIDIPTIEVHLSNIHAREEIRRHSLLAPYVWGQITGFGYRSYLAALDLLYSRITEEQEA